jgi:enoyl-CoA hydratase/carnithine racemase
MSDLATLTSAGRIATLTLNRPEVRNAMSTELLAALHTRVDELKARQDISVLLLTGAGTAFCAGMDLKAVLGDPTAPLVLLNSLAEFTVKLRSLPMVVVAKVNGAAIGGGCGLACVADIALTYAQNKMGFPEVDLGVCPAVVAPWLVRKIGQGRARRVLLSGGLLSGREACDLGIVDHCLTTPAELDAATDQLLERLEAGGPHALVATKNLLNQLDSSLNPEYARRGAELSAKVLCMPETQDMLRQKLGK